MHISWQNSMQMFDEDAKPFIGLPKNAGKCIYVVETVSGDPVCSVSGPSFTKPCNFTRNYAVCWSQLTMKSQCSLRPVS